MTDILKILMACFLIWILVRTYSIIRQNPAWWKEQDWGKSFRTMGVLALCLIVLVALMVQLAAA